MSRRLNPLPQLVADRLARIQENVDRSIWVRRERLAVEGSPVTDEMLDVRQAASLLYTPVTAGEHFGAPHGDWSHRWFRVRIPAAREGERGRRFLRWKCQGETTACIDGVPWAGLDPGHPTCPLPDTPAVLYLDTATWQTGIWTPEPPEAIGPYGLRFDFAELRIRDAAAWDLKWDLDALRQLGDLLIQDEDAAVDATGHGYRPAFDDVSPLLRRLVRGIDECCDAWVSGGVDAMRAATRALLAALPAESWQPEAALIGHAHIDVVWLWPEIATRHKNVHSFATQLRMLSAYPEMVFAHSTPAVYRAVQEDAPALIPQIKHQIAAGRWELMGGFEVEPDVNMPAGEALARSAVYGNRFIAAFTGAPSDVCWIPDVFGYSNCLPQILRLAGISGFYTTKITWSQVSRFPYTSFVWRGSDAASEVVAHLATTGYNGQVRLEENRGALRRHRQLDVHDAMLIGTGLGDGGGGPSEAEAERARRFRDLAGSPRHTWRTSASFFAELERVRDRLPVYQGELYMEAHRGVLTSQAEYKRLYRACEVALRTHEALRVADGGEPLGEQAWLRVLFGQFHDALPGSSIGRVYDDLEAEFDRILSREEEATAAELSNGADAVAFNPVAVHRRVYLAERDLLLDLPPLGTAPLTEAPGSHAAVAGVGASPTRLDNGIVQASFDHDGQLVGLVVDGRRLELTGAAGLRLGHDDPHNYDAWEIDHYTAGTMRPVADRLQLAVAEHSGRRGVLAGRAPMGDSSRATVRYLLDPGSRFLLIEIDVDWQEEHRLLRYHLPTGYRGRTATFGAPFGSIERPQLPGRPEDEAMWEVAGSRWAAVHDDDGTGLAILTEAKYGFSCFDGELGVSLLKAARHPDPAADTGRHTIRFAVGRHQPATLGSGPDAVLSSACAADALFAPVPTTGAGAARPSPFVLEHPGSLCPAWVLPSETGSGYVIRAHETAGRRGTAELRLAKPAGTVTLVDFREQERGAPRRVDETTCLIDYAPYQVVSVLVRSP